jgi:hypothetical protein
MLKDNSESLPPNEFSLPGYVSGHATTGAAAAEILSYLFPAEEDYFHNLSYL